MYSSNDSSSRQIRNDLKRRRMDSNGKDSDLVKRVKHSENPHLTRFDHLPNEIYYELFDYLCPLQIVHSFSNLNYRLNAVMEHRPMKLSLTYLSKIECKRVLKQLLPKITQQTIAIELGQSPKRNNSFPSSFRSEMLIDSFTQSYPYTQFPNLRSLSLTSPTLQQLESLFLNLSDLSSLRSLRLLEQVDYCSQNESVCQLTLANRHSHRTHLFIETSPPFKTVILLQKHFVQKPFFDSLQLNIRCAPFFYPHCLTHLQYDALSRLTSTMNYLKLDLISGTFTPGFDLIRHFPQIDHLSMKTNLQAYANGEQWADFFTEMSNITQLDLNISLDSDRIDQEFQTFQTKFWLERQWFVRCVQKHCKPSQYQLILRNNPL